MLVVSDRLRRKNLGRLFVRQFGPLRHRIWTTALCPTILAGITIFAGMRPADAGRRIIVQSYAKEVAEDALNYVQYLLQGIDEESAPLFGRKLRRLIHTRLSQDAGNFNGAAALRAKVEQGRQEFIEGEYKKAIKTLEGARKSFMRKIALLAKDQRLRRPLREATLFLAHAYLRNGKRPDAKRLIREAYQGAPDEVPSLATHGPEVVDIYKEVRATERKKKKAKLRVTTSPAGCNIFVNERYVGVSPTAMDLPEGPYRVYVQRSAQRGRVHRVQLKSGSERNLRIDFWLDQVLRTASYVGFLYPSNAERRRYEREHASRLGNLLQADEVVIFSSQRRRGKRQLVATVIRPSDRSVIREATLALEPSQPTPDQLTLMGYFIQTGRHGPGIEVVDVRSRNRGSSDSGRAGSGMSWWWPSATLALGVASLAAGIPLMIIHGDGTCDQTNCREQYNTMAPGVALAATGGAAIVASTVLFIIKGVSTPEKETKQVTTASWVTPWFNPDGVGVAAGFSY